jgi:hypothetical protein
MFGPDMAVIGDFVFDYFLCFEFPDVRILGLFAMRPDLEPTPTTPSDSLRHMFLADS